MIRHRARVDLDAQRLQIASLVEALRQIAAEAPTGEWEVSSSSGYGNITVRVGGKPMFATGGARHARPRAEIQAAAAYVAAASPETLLLLLDLLEVALAERDEAIQSLIDAATRLRDAADEAALIDNEPVSR